MVLDDDNGWFDEMNDQQNWLKPYFQLGSDSYQTRSGHGRCSIKKKLFLRISQYSQENTCWSLFLITLQTSGQTQTQVSTQMFSFEYCGIFKNTYFEKHLRTTAFDAVTRI